MLNMTIKEMTHDIHCEINDFLEENLERLRGMLPKSTHLKVIGNGYSLIRDSIENLEKLGYRGFDEDFSKKPYWNVVPDHSIGMSLVAELIENIKISFRGKAFDLNSVKIRHFYFCKIEEANEVSAFQNGLPVYKDYEVEREIFSGILDIIEPYELHNAPEGETSDIWIIHFTEVLSVFILRVGDQFNMVSVIRSTDEGDTTQTTLQ